MFVYITYGIHATGIHSCAWYRLSYVGRKCSLIKCFFGCCWLICLLDWSGHWWEWNKKEMQVQEEFIPLYKNTRLILFAVDRWASRISRSLYFLCVSMFIMRSLKTTFFFWCLSTDLDTKRRKRKWKNKRWGCGIVLCVFGESFLLLKGLGKMMMMLKKRR